jgi:hypothetical protein
MTRHGSTRSNSWKPARVLTILNNPSCKYGGNHLAINRGRRAQCRLRFFFRRTNRLTSSIKEADAPSLPSSPALALARARATRRPHEGTAHCRRHHAVPPTSASPPRPHRCSVLAGFAASTLAPSALPLFTLTTSCRSPHRRPSVRDAAAALLAYKRSEVVTSPIISPSAPSRFAPLAEPLLTSPAHSRDEAPTVDPLPRAVPRQGEMAGSSPTINSAILIKAQNTHQAVST